MKKLAFALTVTSGAAALTTQHDADASTQHTVQTGESLWSIAQTYNTTVDQIKQANGLTQNLVFPGQVLTIENETTTSAQFNGTHVVQAGESLNVIASTYGVSVQDLMNANNLNSYIIYPAQTLSIPGGSGGTLDSTISGNAPTDSVVTPDGYTSPTFNHLNLYDWGQCTWHVFNRRAETGQPISTYWWNADHWANNATQDGYMVDHNPTVGSIMQNFEGPVGHVAYVERVNGDGSILISEMNYSAPPGTVTYRTIPASMVTAYNYIH
ncbi:LysM peptidoglycan-binding domain-containing protein [Staphylococcus canis]|uniref:LysM peptidoglycan-binding domain-containing protein n=1 Tax=Staphylococcus canis TaxID=2724942 RepID=A0ABS0T7R4_9STAP|nr:LysM peptidoglycan-binding domain-containing protein [Staphylococcus canis]MBI5973986.1 LysM peptidoglycan-binding domain-containing protein [Staphylococcus canis]